MAREKHALLIEPLRAVAIRLGYALAVHGSLARDIDLIAVPWTVEAVDQDTLARALIAEVERVNGYAFVLDRVVNVDPYDFSKRSPEPKPHGRKGWSIHLGGAGAYVDLSVMPTIPNPVQRLHEELDASCEQQIARQRDFDQRQLEKESREP